MDTHEGTGILPKAACSRHPALAPSQFQRARLPESSLKIGVTPTIAAEIHHNVHLHLALIQSGYGVGLLPARFIARKEFIGTVEVLPPRHLSCTCPSQ